MDFIVQPTQGLGLGWGLGKGGLWPGKYPSWTESLDSLSSGRRSRGRPIRGDAPGAGAGAGAGAGTQAGVSTRIEPLDVPYIQVETPMLSGMTAVEDDRVDGGEEIAGASASTGTRRQWDMPIPEPFRPSVSPSRSPKDSRSYLHDEILDGFHPWRSGEPYVHRPPEYHDGEDSWEHCRKLAMKSDAEMCTVWKAEVDNLLIFAGLFSATVTAFTIESYKWLQADSKSYDSQILALIYEGINPESGSLNLSTLSDPFPDGPAVRINAYWFLSLTLSLATVLIGILSAQWLREYQRDVSLSPKARLALRQMRYEGLSYWQVPRIIAMLPLILQLAFILFLLGIVELLWVLNRTVATAVTAAVGSVFLFLCITIILPAMQFVFPGDRFLRVPQCPYKSPQSLGFLRFVLGLLWLMPRKWKDAMATKEYTHLSRLFSSSYQWTWVHFDVRWRETRDARSLVRGAPLDIIKDSQDIIHALKWMMSTFDQTVDNVVCTLKCLLDLPSSAALQLVPNVHSYCNLGISSSEVTDEIQQDLLTVAYLRGYQRAYPSLRAYYWESQIRLMNTNPVPNHSVDWSAHTFPVKELPEDVHLQLLNALIGMVRRDVASPDDIQNVWLLLRAFMASDRSPQVSSERNALIFNLFKALEVWLTCQGGINSQDRIRLSIEGVRRLVHPQFYVEWGGCAGYEAVQNFVRKLKDLGGISSLWNTEKNSHISAVEYSWPDCVSWMFQEV